MFVVVHDIDIGPPAYIPPKTTAVLARAMASLNAQALLGDPESPFFFDKVCNCSIKDKVENAALYRAAADLTTNENDVDAETVEGFATSAQTELAKNGDDNVSVNSEENDEDEDEDEDEDGEASAKAWWREHSMDLD